MTATVMVSIAQATDQPAPEADVGWWAGRAAVLQSRCPVITNGSHIENHQLVKREKRLKSLEPWKSLSFLFEYVFPYFISHFEIYEHSLKWEKKLTLAKVKDALSSVSCQFMWRRVKVSLCSQKSARNARSSMKPWLLFRTEPSENGCWR